VLKPGGGIFFRLYGFGVKGQMKTQHHGCKMVSAFTGKCKVSQVLANSPAAEAGLQPGDQIIATNDVHGAHFRLLCAKFELF
jgi:S1-C subfamily serine protease